MQPVTLKCLAQELSLSTGTVSCALNNSYDINAATRQTTMEAACWLAYQLNHLAQSRKCSATNTTRVVAPDIERPFFANVVSGIQQVADEAGYQVMIWQSKESYETELRTVRALLASCVDSLGICYSLEINILDYAKVEACQGIPVVYFDWMSNEVNSSRVIIDDWGGSFLVTGYLISRVVGALRCWRVPSRCSSIRSGWRATRAPLSKTTFRFGPSGCATTHFNRR